MTPDSLREKARAVAMRPIRDTDEMVSNIAAAMKEVAEEAVKNERVTISNLDRQVAHLNDRLDAFTSATPDSPEVKEAMEWVAFIDKRTDERWPKPSEHCRNLAHALRAAQVRIEELESEERACIDSRLKAAQERIDMAEFLIRGGDRDGALSVLRGGPISAEKKS